MINAIKFAIEEIEASDQYFDHTAYVIASSGTNASDLALNDRLAAMRKAVHDAPNADALQVDFYDRSRLATWTRNHPGLMLWVPQRIGRAVAGWRSYEAWAVSPDGVGDVYLLDEKARLHLGVNDEKGMSTKDGIARMREALRAISAIASTSRPLCSAADPYGR